MKLPFVQFRKLFCDCVIVADLHLLSSGVLGGEAKLAAELIIVHAGAVVVGVGDCVVIFVKEDSGIDNLL